MKTKIGVGCIINRDGKVLLGERLNSHGAGTWSFPGGHLEENEHPFDCAVRETLEECGLDVENPQYHQWSFDHFKEKDTSYITLFVTTNYASGEPEICEPDKCARWEWFDWDNLPEPLFAPIKSLTP